MPLTTCAFLAYFPLDWTFIDNFGLYLGDVAQLIEVYDIGGDFYEGDGDSKATFTAPSDGDYYLSMHANISAHTVYDDPDVEYPEIGIVTPSAIYRRQRSSRWPAAHDWSPLNHHESYELSIVVPLTAGDAVTYYIYPRAYGGYTLLGDPDHPRTWVCGYLIP